MIITEKLTWPVYNHILLHCKYHTDKQVHMGCLCKNAAGEDFFFVLCLSISCLNHSVAAKLTKKIV